MARTAKSTIQIEWFNVTYRAAITLFATAVLLALGAGGYWYYRWIYTPKAEAASAISQAEQKLSEASGLRGDSQVTEIVGNAGVAFQESQQAFRAANYESARISAIRSENFSLQAIRLVVGEESATQMVRFYRFEGDVRVKKSGEFSWNQANNKMVLHIGDQVKTSSSASAQLIYFDGTVTTIEAGSLMEIRELYEDPVTKVRRVQEKLNFGELQASTQKRNVAGSYHEISTDNASARAEDVGEFRVKYDRQTETTAYDVFEGRIEVASRGQRESLIGGERIKATRSGKLSDKDSLPATPQLVSPRDQRVFISEKPETEEITLNWQPVSGASRYHLVISDRTLFTTPLYDAERAGTSAVLGGVAPGSYFWKVAAINAAGAESQFSPPRRFRVSSEKIRDRSDTAPPLLEVTEFVPVGLMVIINGRTEPGASLWIDAEKIDVDDDGTFYAVVRLRKEGLNELKFLSSDNAGNETTLTKTAHVELY